MCRIARGPADRAATHTHARDEQKRRRGHSFLGRTEIEHGNATRVSRGVNTEREGERDRLYALVRETRIYIYIYIVVVVVVVAIFVETRGGGWCNSDTRSLTEFLPVGGGPRGGGGGRAGGGREMEAIRGPQYRRILRICYFPRRPN